MSERRGEDWSDNDSGLGIEALDRSAVDSARNLLDRTDDTQRRTYARASEPDLLRALGLLTPRGTLTNAAALLLTSGCGNSDQIAYIHRRTPAGDLSVSEHLW